MDKEKSPPQDEKVKIEIEEQTSVPVISRGWRAYLKQNAVLLLTLLGVVLGFAIGFGVRELNPSDDALMWIGMPGELFMRMLNLLIVPLVVGSVITGEGSGGSGFESDVIPFETQDIFADLLRNLVPNNIVEVAFRKAQTQYSTKTHEVSLNLTNGTIITEYETTRTKSNGKTDSVNVLGLIFICAVLGIAANRLGEKAKVFVQFFAAATDIVIMVLRWFFWTTPVGVASLIATSIAGIDDVEDSFAKLGKFVGVVALGLVVHQLGVLSLLLFALTRRNPFAFHLSIMRPYFIGFASTSTAVAIPEMLHCCEVKNKIDQRVARFAIPFSSAVSANGSAIFIVSAAIFIAQYIGYPLTPSDIIVIGVLTAVSAMAIPSVPSASIVTLIIVLAALNIPSGQIALLFAVEWFLDRLRTGTNVVSHCQCAAITYHFVKKDLERQKSTVKDEDDPIEKGETNYSFIEENGVAADKTHIEGERL